MAAKLLTLQSEAETFLLWARLPISWELPS